jgi:TatD DNase family protein
MLFDSHAHYDNERFADDRHEIIKKAYDSGVSYILNPSSDIESLAASVSLAHEFEFVYAAVGVHPHEVKNMNDNTLAVIEEYAKDKKVVAIGEIGLDYHYDHSPRELQKHWFAQQINLAKKLDLPIIVHDRDAHEDTMNLIRSEDAKTVGGVFHCFAGSVEMSRELLDNNFYISTGGAVTFKNARRIVEVIKYVPIERLLIETDSPYLTPEPFRGKRNYSAYVRVVAEKISEIKGMEFDKVADITLNNAKKLFRIK